MVYGWGLGGVITYTVTFTTCSKGIRFSWVVFTIQSHFSGSSASKKAGKMTEDVSDNGDDTDGNTENDSMFLPLLDIDDDNDKSTLRSMTSVDGFFSFENFDIYGVWLMQMRIAPNFPVAVGCSLPQWMEAEEYGILSGFVNGKTDSRWYILWSFSRKCY